MKTVDKIMFKTISNIYPTSNFTINFETRVDKTDTYNTEFFVAVGNFRSQSSVISMPIKQLFDMDINNSTPSNTHYRYLNNSI